MVRSPARLALTAAALAAAAMATLAVARRPGPSVGPGSAFPAALARSGGRGEVMLAWVFRSEDYLSCSAPAVELRRVQRALGGRVRVVAVAVGSEHRGWVPAFFRRERVRAEIAYVDVGEYHRLLGGSPLPAMYLVQDGTIRKVFFTGPLQARSAPRLAAIAPSAQAALGTSPRGEGKPAPPPHPTSVEE